MPKRKKEKEGKNFSSRRELLGSRKKYPERR